jgi:hypothetical protein
VKVKCVKAFGSQKPGDVSEVPDGSEFSDLHFEPVAADAAPAKPVSAPVAPDTLKAGA